MPTLTEIRKASQMSSDHAIDVIQNESCVAFALRADLKNQEEFARQVRDKMIRWLTSAEFDGAPEVECDRTNALANAANLLDAIARKIRRLQQQIESCK